MGVPLSVIFLTYISESLEETDLDVTFNGSDTEYIIIPHTVKVKQFLKTDQHWGISTVTNVAVKR